MKTYLFSYFSTLLQNKDRMRISVIFCIGAFIGIIGAHLAPVHLDVQLQTKEKGSIQFFFDTGSGFNETQSKRIGLTETPDFVHYTLSTQAYGLRAIRIDPIDSVGQFEILSLQVNYLFWHQQWIGSTELSYLQPVHELKVNPIFFGGLSGQATGSDPSIIINELGYLKRWQLIGSLIIAVLVGLIFLSISIAIRHVGGLKAIFAKVYMPEILILFVASFLRINYLIKSGLPSEPNRIWDMWPDEGSYFTIAQYISSHGLVDYLFSEKSVMSAPGNPVYIALIYTFTNSINAIRILNLTLSVLTIFLIYKLGKKVFSRHVGLLSAGVCALHAQLIGYSATILTEPLFLFLFIAGIYSLMLLLGSEKVSRASYKKYSIATAIFLTMAMLTRSLIILLPAFLLISIAIFEIYRGFLLGKFPFVLLRRAITPLLVPIIIIGIIVAKNSIVFDRLITFTGSGAALWLGSRADTEGDEPPYRNRTYDTEAITQGETHITIKGDTLLMAAAKKNIRENPLAYMWWNIKKVGRLSVGSNLAWFYPNKSLSEWFRASGGGIFSAAVMIFQIILASCIVVLGILGLVAYRKREPFGLITAASVVYIIVFSVPFLVAQRYGLPLVILLVTPASAVIYDSWKKVGNLRMVLCFGLLVILTIVFQILFYG